MPYPPPEASAKDGISTIPPANQLKSKRLPALDGSSSHNPLHDIRYQSDNTQLNSATLHQYRLGDSRIRDVSSHRKNLTFR